jgi:hypothetical protein
MGQPRGQPQKANLALAIHDGITKRSTWAALFAASSCSSKRRAGRSDPLRDAFGVPARDPALRVAPARCVFSCEPKRVQVCRS